MDSKLEYINKILYTENKSIETTPEYLSFVEEFKNSSIDDKFNKFADVVLTNSYHKSIVNNCKIILLCKANSGITGATNEKNINYIYFLLNKNL
jgi:hypothetical protein